MKTVIWYGSLLSEESAEKTCKVHGFQYGYIKNYSRIFNKLWYNIFQNKYNNNTSMLNIKKQPETWLIISYFKISDENYKKMREREWDYNEVEIDIYNESKERISIWIVFISKEYSLFHWKKIKLLHENIQPEKRYIDYRIF